MRFADTTIVVDRVLESNDELLQDRIDEALDGSLPILCTFSKLEYKRVVLQRIALALRILGEEESFFSAMKRATKIRGRSAQVLVSILAWAGQETNGTVDVQVGSDIDAQLRLKAESFLRNAIEYLWYRFDAMSTGIVDQTQCGRAREAPKQKSSGAFDVTIHKSLCTDKLCRNASFLREQLPKVKAMLSAIKSLEEDGHQISEEIKDAVTTLDAVIKSRNFSRVQDYSTCLSIGDVWIHLECLAAKVSAFVTTNYKESEILCPALGLTPVIVSKPSAADRKVAKKKG